MLSGFLPTDTIVPNVDLLELVCIITIFFVFNKTLADLALTVWLTMLGIQPILVSALPTLATAIIVNSCSIIFCVVD